LKKMFEWEKDAVSKKNTLEWREKKKTWMKIRSVGKKKEKREGKKE